MNGMKYCKLLGFLYFYSHIVHVVQSFFSYYIIIIIIIIITFISQTIVWSQSSENVITVNS